MLTNAAAKAAGAQSRAYKMTDQGGLHLLVRPTGTKSWQQKYRWRGREKLLTLGQFPEVNVARARILQAEAKELLEQGVDPSKKRATGKTLEALGRAWFEKHCRSWSLAHASDVLSTLERDIFPDLGARPARSMKARAWPSSARPVPARPPCSACWPGWTCPAVAGSSWPAPAWASWMRKHARSCVRARSASCSRVSTCCRH